MHTYIFHLANKHLNLKTQTNFKQIFRYDYRALIQYAIILEMHNSSSNSFEHFFKQRIVFYQGQIFISQLLHTSKTIISQQYNKFEYVYIMIYLKAFINFGLPMHFPN